MRILAGVLTGMAGLVLAGAGAGAQEYGYYRYFGPGPYAYEPPPAYYAPPPPVNYAPPPRYYYPPQPYYGYAAPYEEYDGYVPPPPPRFRVQPPVRPKAPDVAATQRAPTKTASVAEKIGPVSCAKAQDVVAGYGFGNVKPVTCEGKIFGFSALRDGKTYRVQVSAVTGEITEVRKQP
ncbi:MAG: hypothetical protein NWR47_06515 [Aestuariivirgaceae bacterium]|nr:hypothetical protein [Aestuariivirgaceae bacterium]